MKDKDKAILLLVSIPKKYVLWLLIYWLGKRSYLWMRHCRSSRGRKNWWNKDRVTYLMEVHSWLMRVTWKRSMVRNITLILCAFIVRNWVIYDPCVQKQKNTWRSWRKLEEGVVCFACSSWWRYSFGSREKRSKDGWVLD